MTRAPVTALTMCLLLGGCGDDLTAIIPSDRLPLPGTWESAGVEGGIPKRDVVCADVTAAPHNADATGATSAVGAIQSAIDACPEGQVVQVPAGTYLIDGTLSLKSPITLRGAGAATQLQVESGLAARIGSLGPWPPPKVNDGYRMTITSGATRGSTTVDVADTGAIEVGTQREVPSGGIRFWQSA